MSTEPHGPRLVTVSYVIFTCAPTQYYVANRMVLQWNSHATLQHTVRKQMQLQSVENKRHTRLSCSLFVASLMAWGLVLLYSFLMSLAVMLLSVFNVS